MSPTCEFLQKFERAYAAFFATSGTEKKETSRNTGLPAFSGFNVGIRDTSAILNQGNTSALKAHQGVKPYQCQICDRTFTRKSGLRQHGAIHTGKKPYKCKYCQRGFVRGFALRRHLFIHVGEKPYKCQYCERGFAQKSDLKAHELLHTGEKHHKCQYCQKLFARKGGLKEHIRIHFREKPFQCEQCDRSFRQSGFLNYRIALHTGEKRYQCGQCPKKYTRKLSFQAHVHTHHQGVKGHLKGQQPPIQQTQPSSTEGLKNSGHCSRDK